MTDYLKIVSIANCGVLICTDKTTILIDGICEETEYFDGLNAQTYQKMIKKQAPFEKIDYILYTHSHRDHFDCSRLTQYIATHKISGLFLPQELSWELTELQNQINKDKIKFVRPEFGAKTNKWIMGDTLFTYFNTAHSGKEYENVNHYSLLIETRNKTIYFSGDSTFSDDSQIKILKDVDVDIAFYNPYHLNSSSGRKIITEIDAKLNYIYHIPPEGKDDFNIRKRTIRDIQKYQNILPQTYLILENNIDLIL